MHGQTLSTGRAWVFCSSCPDSPSPPPPQGTSGGVLWSICTQNRPSAGWVAVQPLWPSEELVLTKLFSDAAFLVLGKTPPQSLVWLLCVPSPLPRTLVPPGGCHPAGSPGPAGLCPPRPPLSTALDNVCVQWHCSLLRFQGLKLFLQALRGHWEISDCSVCTWQAENQDLLLVYLQSVGSAGAELWSLGLSCSSATPTFLIHVCARAHARCSSGLGFDPSLWRGCV